ncbi:MULTISPECIES: DUF2922 domain-containing protein [Enterococcus]|uniref:DUF2922 family protein n=1 Tax=Enterococcus malodoratus ATCC 43197 TaxID=1158601 RepID=R2RD25_9ENTE|nr:MULTISPECIES: DUF2922 domain-containing protein [Enterococcus]EOH73884.1 hypothetical protein UAI_03560 [Enterococcus malodoratus ATCC 43197]EOT67222.1 hypothetical protein I585_02743 [Enterococcus malodoratus ATCC 43197]OJG59396.1 hypothetical protein RV07_GL002650 [Enterococcus malodoratus]SPW90900.1 Protein of uncharacterised function (DUF2922) [Enterococcus malodoratus]STD69526.1 Protein of uncharacterised function (DUF2922) [Enterococcus malodoratus]
MINNQHDLVATFTNGLGKEHNWTYKDVNPDLPAPAIKDACELLTNLDIFEQNGVKLFDSIVTAKIVTTKETEIFDVKNDPKNEEKQPLEEVKTAKEEESAEPKIGELGTVKCENTSASFPAVSLPDSQVLRNPNRLSQRNGNDSKSMIRAKKMNRQTNNKIPQPPNLSPEKTIDSLRQRFTQLWNKNGTDKEDPS